MSCLLIFDTIYFLLLQQAQEQKELEQSSDGKAQDELDQNSDGKTPDESGQNPNGKGQTTDLDF